MGYVPSILKFGKIVNTASLSQKRRGSHSSIERKRKGAKSQRRKEKPTYDFILPIIQIKKIMGALRIRAFASLSGD